MQDKTVCYVQFGSTVSLAAILGTVRGVNLGDFLYLKVTQALLGCTKSFCKSEVVLLSKSITRPEMIFRMVAEYKTMVCFLPTSLYLERSYYCTFVYN